MCVVKINDLKTKVIAPTIKTVKEPPSQLFKPSIFLTRVLHISHQIWRCDLRFNVVYINNTHRLTQPEQILLLISC